MALLTVGSPYSPSTPVWQPQKDPVPRRKCNVRIHPRMTVASETGLSSGHFVRTGTDDITFQILPNLCEYIQLRNYFRRLGCDILKTILYFFFPFLWSSTIIAHQLMCLLNYDANSAPTLCSLNCFGFDCSSVWPLSRSTLILLKNEIKSCNMSTTVTPRSTALVSIIS